MKPFHDGPLTLKKRHSFSSADGANYGEATSLRSRGSSDRNRPMRRRVPDKLQVFSSGATPDGKQTSTEGRGFRALRIVSMAIVPITGGPQTTAHPAQTSFHSSCFLVSLCSHGTSHPFVAGLHRQLCEGLKTSANALHRPGGEPGRISAPSANAGVRRHEGDNSSQQQTPLQFALTTTALPHPSDRRMSPPINSQQVPAEPCSASPDPLHPLRIPRRIGLPIAWSRCSQRPDIRHVASVISVGESLYVLRR